MEKVVFFIHRERRFFNSGKKVKPAFDLLFHAYPQKLTLVTMTIYIYLTVEGGELYERLSKRDAFI